MIMPHKIQGVAGMRRRRSATEESPRVGVMTTVRSPTGRLWRLCQSSSSPLASSNPKMYLPISLCYSTHVLTDKIRRQMF